MSFPFGNYYGNCIEDSTVPEDMIYFFAPKYRWVPVEGGLREEIDWEATARASAVIVNIGDGKK